MCIRDRYEPSKQHCELCGSVLLQQVRYGKKTLVCSNENCPNATKEEQAPSGRQQQEERQDEG